MIKLYPYIRAESSIIYVCKICVGFRKLQNPTVANFSTVPSVISSNQFIYILIPHPFSPNYSIHPNQLPIPHQKKKSCITNYFLSTNNCSHTRILLKATKLYFPFKIQVPLENSSLSFKTITVKHLHICLSRHSNKSHFLKLKLIKLFFIMLKFSREKIEKVQKFLVTRGISHTSVANRIYYPPPLKLITVYWAILGEKN